MLQIKLAFCDIKACHIVPGTFKGNSMPTVICKFLYFAVKNLIWTEKTKIMKREQPYKRTEYLHKRTIAWVQSTNQARGEQAKIFITSTHNCTVFVSWILINWTKKKFFRVNEIKDLDKLIPVN